METAYLARNFLHLTGIVPISDVAKNSVGFYEMCLKQRLKLSDFAFSKDGTTELKLTVLPQLISIARTARMVGDYGEAKPRLYTEKLAGTVNACLGFIDDGGYYVPNTALREDIRDISRNGTKRVLAAYEKGMRETGYQTRDYLAKGVNLESLKIPASIRSKIALWQCAS